MGQFPYQKIRQRALFLMPVLLLILMGLDLGSVLYLPWFENWFEPEMTGEKVDFLWKILIFNLQLPHVLAVVLVGSALGLSGGVLQSYLRNPLADPALIGLSSGGSLSTACFLMLARLENWVVSLWGYVISALLGVFLVLFFLLRLAVFLDRLGIAGIILIGIGVNACLGAVLSCAMVFLDQSNLNQVLIWGLGSFQLPSYFLLVLSLGFWIVGSVGVYLILDDLDKLNFGERAAFSMGVNLQKLKIKVLISVSCLMGVAVMLAGPMAFVGLLAPHFARYWTGPRARFLLLGSAICGAVWLLLADLLASFWIEGQLPVGIVCALLGGPFFIGLLIKMARRSRIC